MSADYASTEEVDTVCDLSGSSIRRLTRQQVQRDAAERPF